MPSLSRIDELRRLLADLRGPALWQQLDQLAEHRALRELVEQQFPHLSRAPAMDRRGFLRFAAAAVGGTGLSACSGPPPERIVPQQRLPETTVPGKPVFYASTLTQAGSGIGVLVETHGNRPTKIEGNPGHPSSLGATGIHAQAAIMDLWDPDRSPMILRGGTEVGAWNGVLAEFAKIRQAGGDGLRLMTPSIASPTLRAQIETLLDELPGARWHRHDAVDLSAAAEGARIAFGQALQPQYRLDRAELIALFDADLLAQGPGHLRHARDFAKRREPPQMNRLYVAEPSPTPSGSLADHRLPIGGERVAELVRLLAAKLGIGDTGAALDPTAERWIAVLAEDLRAAGPAALVAAGPAQPPSVHALVWAINHRLGAVGHTLQFIAAPRQGEPYATLLSDMEDGKVETLLMLDVNPAYDAPQSARFAEALQRIPRSVHSGLYTDETARLSHWHIPLAHALECWSDAEAHDGSASLQQPMIAPLYGARPAHEILAALRGDPRPQARDIVQAHWRQRLGDAGFDTRWHDSLRQGLIEGTAAATLRPALRELDLQWPPPLPGPVLEIRPDPTLWDGRQANNAWLQELPKPIALNTWGNLAWVGARLAQQYDIENGDVLRLSTNGVSIEIAALVLSGQAQDSLTVHLGHGRRAAGRIASDVGVDVAALRPADGAWRSAPLKIEKTGERRILARVQTQDDMEGREPVRRATLAEYRQHDGALVEDETPQHSFYDANPPQTREPGKPAWGMSVDLNACLGCMNCTIACQSENNIPTVGREQVDLGRAMHWIRVDRYFEGPAETPEILSQPVPCMHCEHAPCELVCPVGATVHDDEGLNVQVYNRCVGTRFCGNNCPYSVRRFNFLQYADRDTESLRGGRNPDVTVRSRGVMEKCSFCIQRISAARIQAENEGREIGDGEVVTACQSACPTQAITFGNIADKDSAVSKKKASPRNYDLLAELNTRPRTSYLARLRNPNPALETSGEDQA
ncbi:MAG: 4Fe-4S dicluster domain-containing protein [Pseudomonadota bacterium]|nr:4Fe-4S dicluster domain-containing protein [Pseudomonadota bacterium]